MLFWLNFKLFSNFKFFAIRQILWTFSNDNYLRPSCIASRLPQTTRRNQKIFGISFSVIRQNYIHIRAKLAMLKSVVQYKRIQFKPFRKLFDRLYPFFANRNDNPVLESVKKLHGFITNLRCR